jgi:hypothetical protein
MILPRRARVCAPADIRGACPFIAGGDPAFGWQLPAPVAAALEAVTSLVPSMKALQEATP